MPYKVGKKTKTKGWPIRIFSFNDNAQASLLLCTDTSGSIQLRRVSLQFFLKKSVLVGRSSVLLQRFSSANED